MGKETREKDSKKGSNSAEFHQCDQHCFQIQEGRVQGLKALDSGGRGQGATQAPSKVISHVVLQITWSCSFFLLGEVGQRLEEKEHRGIVRIEGSRAHHEDFLFWED